MISFKNNKSKTMNKSVLKALVLAFTMTLIAGVVRGQQTLTIGTGTNYSAGNSSAGTFVPGSVMGNTYYYYSTTQFIYTSSEMGSAKRITSVAFYHNNAGKLIGTLKIYLVNTASSTVSTGSPATTGTLVYTGTNIEIGSDTEGWQTFSLDTPFDYDGTSNLLVIVCRQKGTTGSPFFLTNQGWRYSSTSPNYYYMYRSADSPANYGDISNTSNYTSYMHRPNIKFNYTTPCIILATPTLTATPAVGGVSLSWGAVSNASSYTVEWGTTTACSDGSQTVTGTSTTISFTYGTRYFRVKANGNGSTYCDSEYSMVRSAAPISRTLSVSSGSVGCSGSGTVLTATATGFSSPRYTWSASPSDGAGLPSNHTNLTTNTITVTPTTGGNYTYTCSVTEGGSGSATTASITIYVPQTPTVTISPATATACGSYDITPSINTNCGNATYAWSRNGTALGVTTENYTATTSGTYTITVTNSALQQYDLIVQNGVPAIVVVAPTASTTGKAVPIGTGGIGSNTSAGNIAYNAATNLQRAIVVNGGVRYDSGNRTGYVIPIQSCTATASIDVTIDVPPTLTHISGSTSQDACIDNAIENIVYHYTPANASVSVSGLPSGVDYTANSGVLTISGSPTVSATYSYTVTVSSGSCPSATPLTGTIKVANKPNVSVNSPQVCKGSSVTLQASGATSYTWSPTTYLSSGTGSSVSFSSSSTNTYTVTVTGTSGNCSNFAVATVTVKDKVTPTFTNPGPICSGASLTLPTSSNNNSNLTGSAVSGTWSPTVSNTATTTYTFTPTASPDQCASTATMTVTVNQLPSVAVNSPTVCKGTAASLTASGATSYTWSPSTNLSATTGASVSYSSSVNAGTYNVTVTGTSNGCTASAPATVTVKDKVTPTFTNPGPICSGATLTLPASSNNNSNLTGSAVTGTWSPTVNNTATTTYTFTPTASPDQCASTATMTVTVNQLPSVAVNSPTVCKGTAASLTASGATSYTWSPSTNLSATTGASVSYSSSVNAGTYNVTVTGTSNGCTASAPATVTVKDKVTPTFTNPGPICSGATLTLPASSNNNSNLTGSAVTGTWSPTVNNTATTTYTFTPTASPDQCASTATMTVTVNSLPTPTISGETSPCSGESTTLDAGSGYASYLWYDGTTGQTVSPTPSAPTDYSVTVYDGNTCSASTSVTVSPINCCNLTATLSSSSSPSCYNECDGTITVTVDGGTAPITYTWSDGESGTSLDERTGLCADTYTVTVSDANGCVAGGIRETTQECFRITDIMYHSCNADHQEGFNEMFTMLIGPNSLDADNMDISWANNNLSFTGFCENQDAIDGINALITGGGRVIAPAGGVLPANSEVLVVTSQNFDYGSFGFTDLDHDVYILFQCNDDVTDGHFGNTPNGSERHFGVSFSSPSCSDNVSYITTTNVAGDAVHYNADGTVEYYNNGCQAPVFYDEIVLTNPEEITLSYSSISGYQNVDLGEISPVTNCTGTAAYTSTDLPDGLALNSSTGVISGTPEHQEDGNFSVTMTCDGCEATYTVDYHFDEEPDYQGCIIEEDFSEITTGGNTATSGTNGPLGTELTQNFISDFPTTSRAYAAGGVVKLGSSSYSGYIQTAPLNLSVPFYVEFDVKGWTNVEGDIVVTVSGGETQTVSYTATIGSEFETKRINFNAATSNSTVRIATYAKRAFIDNVKVCYPAPCSVEARQIAGVCGGKIIIEAEGSGGMGDFSYAWDNGAGNAAQFNGAVSGTTYTVTATDEVGCEATASVTPVQTGNPEITPSFDAITCNEGTTDIVLTVNGGVGEPYTYHWGESTSTTNTIENVTAGTYHVTVSDANCSAESTISVTEPDAVTFDVTTTPQVCNTPGTATISNEQGGNGSYSYEWSNSSTDASVELTSGNYTVTVRDGNGCLTSAAVTIGSSSTSVSFDATPSNPTCSYETGSIVVNNFVGASPFTVAWDGGSVNNITGTYTITGLTTGDYTVIVTDADGCGSTQTGLSITVPSEITFTISSTPQICTTLGSATVEIANNGNYSYVWHNSANEVVGSNSNELTDVAAGTYSVTVTSTITGCYATETVTVGNNPTIVTFSADATSPDCSYETGSIAVTDIVGTASYTVTWNGGSENGISADHYTISNLGTGTYTVTVTDANGCSATQSGLSITVPSEITFTVSSTPQICTTLGSATVEIANNGNYSYVWHNSANEVVGSNSNELTDVAAGTYSVTVTSTITGCYATETVTVGNNPTIVTFSADATSPDCSYETGSIAVTDIVGTASYTVTWNGGSENGISADHYTISNLGTGTYTVTVTDANGCSATQSGLSVSVPNEITYSVSTVDQVCSTAGSITLESVSGGAGGYSYQWSNSVNEVVGNGTNVLSGVNAGVYNVTVTDARGCEKIDAITLNGSGGTVSFTLVAHETLCHETASGRIEVQGITGRSPYSISWSSAEASGNEDDVTASSCEISNIPAGNYTVVVTDADQCSYTSTANVGQAGEFNATVSLNSPLKCNGDKFDLIAEATGGYLGGGSEYSYIWSNDATTQLLEGLTVFGTYSVSVRDDNGCEATATINVEEPTAVQIAITATEISCHGETATITVSGEGGTGSYTGTGTFENITASATPYTYTIYDTNDCSASDNITITEPEGLTITLADIVDQTCSTQGSARLTITGGSGSISYSWDGGDASAYTSAVTMPLGSGSHTVSVTDGNGCTTSENVNIQNNSGMTVSLNSRQHTRCYEQDGGSFTLDFNNGTSPYEILTWNGETVNETNPSHTFSNLTAGNYGVTITDANGCTDNISVEVEDADEFTANASFTTPIMCHGDSFDITVDANGGTLASGHEYTYAWSNGIDTQSQNGLTTYTTYTVTVRDDNSCEAVSSVEAVNPSEVRIIITADEISCHGGTATITVSGEGGTGSYTGTGTFEDITASAMAYSYTITDGNGCSATDDIAITEPEELTVALSSIVSQTCETLGSVDFAISGGTGSISYSWDGGSANVYASATTEQLGSGSHTISVIDGNGCTATENVSIPNGSGMTLSPNPSQPARCFGENSGSVMIDFVNGTSPYTILWNGNLINETNDYHYFDNLTAGTYDVTVTDANGCSGNTSVEIGQPDDFVATASVTSAINCHDDAFDISASAQGGNGGYTYMWNGSVAGQSQSGLTEYSTYNVVVTDAEGCTATASVTPENPQELTITSIVADAISCHGGTTVVSAYTGGGSGTLNYTWATEGVPAVNSQQITAPAGTYSLTVTDGNGCWVSTTYVVDTPDEISIEITRTTEQYCTTLGEVQLAVGGGTGNLSYTWDGNTINPIVGSSIVSQLSAGTHTLTVTDGNGCTATLPVTIDYGAEMSVAASQPDSVRCFGETNGEFTISMDDGFAPYTIAWNNGTITEYSDVHTFANLSAGTYGVTVTDAHNCMEMISVEVGAPERLMALSSAERILCHGESAEVTVSATGGTLPYQNTGIYNLVAGEYDYMVTDANGCTSSTHVSLSEPTSISVNAVAVNALCFGGNGSATLMISGGTNLYSVVWQDNSTGLDNTHIPVNTNFGYTVTDLNGCTYDGTVAVGQPQQLSLDLSVTPVSCFGLEDARVGVSHIGGGTLPYNYLWSNGNTMNSLVGVGAGTYSLLVTDANGCTISSTAVVTQPEALNVSVVSSNVECGISNGSLSANVYGGSLPYVYYWSNGGTSALLDNVSAGAYSLTVTDANGCSATSSSQINVAGMLSASIVEQSPISCFGMTDATLVAVVEQAQPPVMYQWNNGQNGSTLFGLGTGMYIVTVTDGWGCQGVANYMLYSPTAMIMSSQVTDAKCSNTSEGAISLTVGGGRPPYSYLWTTGSTEPNLEDLRVGSYGVLVTDMSGCTMQENFVISAPTTISVEADVTDITCYGKKDGRVEINVTGGVEPYAYGFYMGNTVSHNGSVYEHLRPGVYNISVSDANGCGKSISVAVGQPERLGVNSMVSAPSCKDLHDATVEIVTAGGTAPFTYTLGTYTSDSSIFINLHPGLYSAVVTDANGCSNEISEIIVPESKLDCLRIPNVITPNGDGVNDEWIIENIELFPEAHIYVYNRWGQLLYHDRGNGERWDGSYRGHFVPSGVYMYIIKLESVEETYEGTVTVLY